MLDATLLGFEADMVRKIPLCHMDQPDELTWPYNANEAYSIKSGYKVQQLEHQNEQLSQFDIGLLKPLWQAIWSLKVLSKVKKFSLESDKKFFTYEDELGQKKNYY